MKKHEIWQNGECPECGETYRYVFEHLGDDRKEHTAKRTCSVCGYFDEYIMPRIPKYPSSHYSSLSWPRESPMYGFKMVSKSEDKVDYGDYVETW